jgi:formylmethanofuran dehydrogenase subunit C
MVRTWHSRTGHRIAIHEDADNKIEIVTKGGQTIILDDTGKKVTVESVGDVEITAQGNMKLKAQGNMDIEANGQVNVKGATINLN